MRVVHLIARPGDARAWETAVRHEAAGHEVRVVLLQDAVTERPGTPLAVSACAADLEARGLGGRWPGLDYEGIVDLIYSAERVISW